MTIRSWAQVVVAALGLLLCMVFFVLLGTARADGLTVSGVVGDTVGSTFVPGIVTGPYRNTPEYRYYSEPETIFVYTPPATKREEVVEEVEYEGDKRCDHDFVTQYIPRDGRTRCAVAHDYCGCPETWPRTGRICRKCLRKEITVNRCEVIPPELTEYEKLDKRVPKK